MVESSNDIDVLRNKYQNIEPINDKYLDIGICSKVYEDVSK